MLVDTDVLIWYLRGHEGGSALSGGAAGADAVGGDLHGIGAGLPQSEGTGTADEGLGSPKSAHPAGVGGDLEPGGGTGEAHALGDDLLLADALIAATAIAQGLTLASANVKHFRVVQGLELMAFEV